MTAYHAVCRLPAKEKYDEIFEQMRYSCRLCNVQITNPSRELLVLQQVITRHEKCGAAMPIGYNVCPSCKILVPTSELAVTSKFYPFGIGG